MQVNLVPKQSVQNKSNQNFFVAFLFQAVNFLRSKLCSLYENDCIFDKFECCWNGNDTAIMTGSYNNFFRMFDRSSRKEVTYEASKEIAKPKTILKPRKVRYECFCWYSQNCLDFVLFVYFPIIQSTFRLFKGQQYLNNVLRIDK